ncbi:MAG: class I SAM-dependent methyltransferase [Candidatus Acidiferrales bacterium]
MSTPFVSRFGQAAGAYSVYRPEYSPEIFEHILAAVPPGHRQLALDLGAGTGLATRVLLEHFAEVIAVEPDPLMVEKLREHVPRAAVHAEKAEDFVQQAESVDLVNIATALHWMDVPRVTENVTCWLRAGGIMAVYGSEFPVPPEPVKTIIREEFAEHWEQFRDPRLRRKEFPQSIVRAAPGLEIFEDSMISHVVPMTPREFAGFCRSTSYGSAYGRSLADEEGYWRDLERRFTDAWPEERIPVYSRFYLILARKI